MELVSLLMRDCQTTSDVQSKLRRLFAGTIERVPEAEKGALPPYPQGLSALGLPMNGERKNGGHKIHRSSYKPWQA